MSTDSAASAIGRVTFMIPAFRWNGGLWGVGPRNAELNSRGSRFKFGGCGNPLQGDIIVATVLHDLPCFGPIRVCIVDALFDMHVRPVVWEIQVAVVSHSCSIWCPFGVLFTGQTLLKR